MEFIHGFLHNHTYLIQEDLRVSKYITVIRPRHWIKNILCLAGIIFSGNFVHFSELIKASSVLIAFSIAASSVYVLNDLIDAPKDKLHHNKQHRPIANGKISSFAAQCLFLGLFVTSLIISWHISKTLLLIIIIYIVLNIAYSLKLKQIPILDVYIISFGFILRLLAGTLAIGIMPTKWIIICTFMISLFFGFVKRYCEMKSSTQITREVILKYSSTTLEKLISITASCTILSYSIFVIGKEQILLTITILPVCYAIFHIILDLNMKQKGEDFSKELFANAHLIISLMIWIISYCLISFYA